MSMSAQSPWLQFITGLPDSPKSEAKGVILVRDLRMRPRVPLTFRLILTMRCLFQVCMSNRAHLLMYFSYVYSYTRVSSLWVICAGKGRRGKLVHWVERASFAKIHRLLEIFEQERHHEILLTMKNLHDHPDMGNVTLEESREASLVPIALQVVHPPEQAIGQLDRAKYTRTGRRKPQLPNHLLVNSYLPPRGPAPPMEEVTVPELEGAQEIVDRWRPFNRGEYSADHLHDLYLTML